MSVLEYAKYSSNPTIREMARCQFWIDNPEVRKERQREIYSEKHICIHCNREMTWSSDHMRFIWFECNTKDCSGESKVFL